MPNINYISDKHTETNEPNPKHVIHTCCYMHTYYAVATYITLQSAKAVLMRKLNNIQSIGSFLRTKDGFKVTNPEGYVAIKQGGAVKLVDRLEFSRANFNMAKNWVKG